MDQHSAVHRAIVVVDVEKFGDPSRTNAHQLAVREGLYESVERAFVEAGIKWERCTWEDRGDGILILVPPDAPKSRLVDHLPARLVAALHRHNAKSSLPSQIRLRVALDAGEVHYDSHGITGAAVNRAFRLLDAAPLKDALAASPGVLALITSDWFYHEIVRHEPGATPDAYRAVRVKVKETDVQAWMRLPDGPLYFDLPARTSVVSRWTGWHWVSGSALLLAVAGATLLLWTSGLGLLDRGGKVFGVAGGVVAMVSLVTSAVAFRLASRARRPDVDPSVARGKAAQDLAGWVERQWRREAAARLLDRPEPLRVRWSSTSRPVAPVPGEVLGTAGPEGRVLRLRLGGDVREVVEKFIRLPYRQLVVLGQPGAGKSVLMMLLTLGLLRRWRTGEQVPVLLNLSSWNPDREHLHAWLARRLVEEYPALGNRDRYGADVATHLVDSGAVLPVLDGLDEMPSALDASAVAGLADAAAGDHAVVVACRADEYQAAVAAAGTTLGRAAVVELEPVDIGAVAGYLPAGQPEGSRRWAPLIAALRTNPDGPLASALSTPLMVYLARAVYSAPDRDPAWLCDPRRWPAASQMEDHLLDAYLPALYAGGGAAAPAASGSPLLGDYPAAQAQRWLANLAARMATLRTRDLAWWQLPQTIPGFGVAFGLAVRILAGIGFGLAFGLTYGFTHGLDRGLLYGLIYGLAFGLGLTAGLKFTRAWVAGLVTGCVAGSIAGVGIGLVLGPAFGVQAALEAAFIGGLGIGLITRSRPRFGNRPRQVELSLPRLLRSMVRALPIGLISGLLLGLIFVLASGHPIALVAGLANGLPFMIGFGTSEAIVLPVDERHSVTPKSLLHGERAATIAQVLAIGLAAWIADLLTTWITNGLNGGLFRALGTSLVFAFIFSLAAGLAAGVNSPWLCFLSAQGWFALRGQLPWHLMRFLDDAHRRGVLRQVGGTYQFRHVRLQDRLASTHRDQAPTRAGGGRFPAIHTTSRQTRWKPRPTAQPPTSGPVILRGT
ncbi:MAG TPA: hypothetical protein VFV67_31975 [Actinophytocola sp.]|uniref:hypothetical protein n=1 Tax=Actinophytocola sp. TaxID=1872138 RepID=UPI002DBE9100|nr:hypothetical protein [Actinophytocola sp.]HEU5475286.1 hypothetical protein [Actinophytocola sp.]